MMCICLLDGWIVLHSILRYKAYNGNVKPYSGVFMDISVH